MNRSGISFSVLAGIFMLILFAGCSKSKTTPEPPTGETRNASDIPFSSTSVWNIGIGQATWGLPGDIDVDRFFQLTMQVTASYFGQPIYFGKASDPLVTFTCAGNGPTGPIPWTHKMHCPIGAQPAGGTDRHINLYDSTQPFTALSMFDCNFVNGVDVTGGVTSFLGGILDLTKNGIDADAGDYIGTDDYLAGVISQYDISQGVIRHALRFALSTDAAKSPNNVYGSSLNVPWPNFHVDYYAPDIYIGPILAGGTIGIPASVDINALGLTSGGLMLAKALQDYGAIWRDSGGTNSVVFYSVPELETSPTIAGMRGDGPKIVGQLRIMRNQSVNGSDGKINGGAPYRVPLLPPLQ